MLVLDIDGVVSNTYEGVPVDEIGEFSIDSLKIKNSKPFEDAWYWINHYSSIYDLMFTTSRDKKFTNVTWEWFREWDIPVDFIVFETSLTDFLSQINPTVYVSDNPVIIESTAAARVNSLLITREYNLSFDIDANMRIASLWDIKCV